jgi:hypothetical protein
MTNPPADPRVRFFFAPFPALQYLKAELFARQKRNELLDSTRQPDRSELDRCAIAALLSRSSAMTVEPLARWASPTSGINGVLHPPSFVPVVS